MRVGCGFRAKGSEHNGHDVDASIDVTPEDDVNLPGTIQHRRRQSVPGYEGDGMGCTTARRVLQGEFEGNYPVTLYTGGVADRRHCHSLPTATPTTASTGSSSSVWWRPGSMAVSRSAAGGISTLLRLVFGQIASASVEISPTQDVTRGDQQSGGNGRTRKPAANSTPPASR